MENDLKEELNRRMRAAWGIRLRRKLGPTDGPRSSCPSVRLDSSSSALLRSADVGDTAATSGKLPTHRALGDVF
ncbi:hypothetical protein RB195_007116 [Necator americanus]|uniref:Uncharacterized protein n=1 Tax=Necator americanus TaxID=51031 RepID=A0ABR1BVP8_NECAM